jgi:hypothetical protein
LCIAHADGVHTLPFNTRLQAFTQVDKVGLHCLLYVTLCVLSMFTLTSRQHV